MKKNMNSYNLFGTILLALIFTTNQAMQKTTGGNKDVELQNIFETMYKNYGKITEGKRTDLIKEATTLIKAGANPNLLISGMHIFVDMPLLSAISTTPIGTLGNKFRNLAKLLIKHGANINAKDHNGQTALMLAIVFGHKDIAELLIDAGADLNAKDHNGQTALMTAIISILNKDNNADMAELLIKAGADVNAKDNEGDTPLMSAIRWGVWGGKDIKKEDMVKLLIDAHADINAKNNYQENALDWAKTVGDADIIKMLQDAQKTEKKGEK